MLLTTTSKINAIKEYMKSGDYDAAVRIAEKVNPEKITSVRDLMTLSNAFLKKRRYEDAKSIYVEMHNHAQTHKVLVGLIELCLKTNSPEEAEVYIREFRKLEPENPERLIYRYRVDAMLGKGPEYLVKSLKKLKDEDYTDVWGLELAKAYYKMGDYEKCAQECKDILLWFAGTDSAAKAHILLGACAEKGVSVTLPEARPRREEKYYDDDEPSDVPVIAASVKEPEAKPADDAPFNLSAALREAVSETIDEDRRAAEEAAEAAEDDIEAVEDIRLPETAEEADEAMADATAETEDAEEASEEIDEEAVVDIKFADEAEELSDEAADEVEAALDEADAFAAAFAAGAADAVEDVTEDTTEAIDSVAEVVSDEAEEAVDEVGEAAEAAADEVADIAETADEAIEDDLEAVEDIAGAVSEEIEDTAEEAADEAEFFFEEGKDAVAETVDAVEDAAEEVSDEAEFFFEEGKEAVAETINAVEDTASEAIDAVEDIAEEAAEDTIDEVADVAEEAADDIEEAIPEDATVPINLPEDFGADDLVSAAVMKAKMQDDDDDDIVLHDFFPEEKKHVSRSSWDNEDAVPTLVTLPSSYSMADTKPAAPKADDFFFDPDAFNAAASDVEESELETEALEQDYDEALEAEEAAANETEAPVEEDFDEEALEEADLAADTIDLATEKAKADIAAIVNSFADDEPVTDNDDTRTEAPVAFAADASADTEEDKEAFLKSLSASVEKSLKTNPEENGQMAFFTDSEEDGQLSFFTEKESDTAMEAPIPTVKPDDDFLDISANIASAVADELENGTPEADEVSKEPTKVHADLTAQALDAMLREDDEAIERALRGMLSDR
ncbi:MAG: hypothetical protein J5738_02720 [Lachnospiraceae bacterium]|nr:hypothetical protein [Lachnospiraceae bacterium]